MAYSGDAGDANKSETGFKDTSFALVRQKLALLAWTMSSCARVISATPWPAAPMKYFRLYILDCDLYGSYKDCLEFFYPRLGNGGIILLDEYDDPPWPGCNKAVDEFLADKPERLQRIERQNYQKFFFRKGNAAAGVMRHKLISQGPALIP